MTAAAVGAAVVGTGTAWWRSRPMPAADGAAIWPLRFDTPTGGQLAMSALRGQRLLLNFWATWCPPCVRELPLLDRFQREQQLHGWRVVGLAVDDREPVREFLAKWPVSFAIGLAGFEGVGLSRAMGNSGGALPFSVVFDRTGKAVERTLGVIQPEDLARWARGVD